MSKILVTGASGFIGNHLCQKLIELRYDVIGLDKEATQIPGARFIQINICDVPELIRQLSHIEFDAVIHLAAISDSRNTDERVFSQNNVIGTRNVLRAINTRHFIFASSAAVYGDIGTPFLESDSCNPLSPYALSKLTCEGFGPVYNRLYGVDFTSLSFSSVYGSGNYHNVAHLIADSITKGTQIPLYNNGKMWRDWVHVSDIVSGIIAAITHHIPGVSTFNLGSGEATELNHFIELIERNLSEKANTRPEKKLPHDMLVGVSSIEKAQKVLGFNPSVSLEDGIGEFCTWYSNPSFTSKRI